eukprot:3704377-Prymnesium_polylepis.1
MVSGVPWVGRLPPTAFNATVHRIADGTVSLAAVVPETYGIYFVRFTPRVLGEYAITLTLRGA